MSEVLDFVSYSKSVTSKSDLRAARSTQAEFLHLSELSRLIDRNSAVQSHVHSLNKICCTHLAITGNEDQHRFRLRNFELSSNLLHLKLINFGIISYFRLFGVEVPFKLESLSICAGERAGFLEIQSLIPHRHLEPSILHLDGVKLTMDNETLALGWTVLSRVIVSRSELSMEFVSSFLVKRDLHLVVVDRENVKIRISGILRTFPSSMCYRFGSSVSFA